jgi:hypothetical protein
MQTAYPSPPSSPPKSPFVEPWAPTPRVKMITTLVVAVIVVLCAATFVVQRIWLTPESAVDGYFGALADRDVTKASSYIKDSGTSTSEIVGAEQYLPPTKLTIDEISKDGNDRTAKVSYFIGETKVSGEIPLHRKDKLTLGLFRGWGIDDGRPSIQISTAAPVDVQVNGKPLPEDAKESGLLEVFPGRYVVSVVDNPLLDSNPVTIDAGFGNSEAILEPKVKASAQSAADAQVKDYLKGCAAKPVDSCPFSSAATRQVWKIDTYPKIQLRLDDSGAVTVETAADGKATVTGLGYGGYPITESSSFTVSGLVTVEQAKLKFQPE